MDEESTFASAVRIFIKKCNKDAAGVKCIFIATPADAPPVAAVMVAVAAPLTHVMMVKIILLSCRLAVYFLHL